MKFKIDENLPVEVKDILVSLGHDVHTLYDENLAGHADSEIAKACLSEKRVLITLDRDFADIRSYPPQLYHGIIVLRYARTDRKYVIENFSGTIGSINDDVIGSLWIVEENRIRIRA